MSTPDLSRLAWDLASDGLVGHEDDVRQVARAARAAGISPVLAGVLADPQEPVAARLRAFGRIPAAFEVHAARPRELASRRVGSVDRATNRTAHAA
jgi:hypothetical protein